MSPNVTHSRSHSPHTRDLIEKFQPGKHRTIWNCSHSVRRDTKGEIVDHEGIGLPVSLSSAAGLPLWLRFE